MVLRVFIVLLFFLASLPADAATTLKGVIRANEEKGEPIANVGLVADGANPTTSESFGRFTLEFPLKSPGDPVEVIVKQEGYVVVNEVQLELTLPARAEDKFLTIILCKEGDREEMARRFYRLKSKEAIEATYQQKLKTLQDEHQADAEAIAKLQQERDQAKALAEKSAEQLAKIQPGQTSEFYQEAKRLFLEGKIEEAIQYLNDEKLSQSVSQAKTAIEDAVQAWVLYSDQGRMEEARHEYVEALQTYRELAQKNPETYRPYVATTLNNLGILYKRQNRMEEARKEYAEALQIRRGLAQENPKAYLPDLADTFNNLGNIDNNQNREEARKEYAEALQIFRELAQKNPVVYLPDAAATLNNLAILSSNQNRMEEAREEYTEALQTYRELAQKNPEIYLPYLAGTLNNLGVLDSDQNRMEEARKEYVVALQIYEALAKGDPERFSADVTRVQELLAELQSKKGP